MASDRRYRKMVGKNNKEYKIVSKPCHRVKRQEELKQ
jgi:hypothetical protein